MNPADLSIEGLHKAYSGGELSPIEALEAVRERVEATEPRIHALYHEDFGTAREAARESELRWRHGDQLGPLDGVPATVKDNIALRGAPMAGGTAASPQHPSTVDAPPAARLKEAGAVIFGKTTMPDFGMLSSGISSVHPTTRNPWDIRTNPGGSSSGAAAAAAAGYGPAHVGTDIGGSIRLPAAWTATVGHKPSLGRVPIDPPYPGRAAGPISRTLADAVRLLEVLSLPDHRDHMSLPYEPLRTGAGDPRGLRIGLLLDAGCGLAVPEAITRAVTAAAETFAGAGAIVEPLDPFFTRAMLDDLTLFWRVRAWEEFSRYTGAQQAAVLGFIADWSRLGADIPGTAVLRAFNRTLDIRRATVEATQPFDYVLSPVAPVAAFPAEHAAPDNRVEASLEHIAFTCPYNMSEQPAISLNCGFTGDGAPIGLQLSGRRFDDAGVLALAAWYESARPAAAVPPWPS
ncbi:amidase [Sciscionella marina]|uniref:amidase n=1 Tax=Sciscionella marina TaxID=508770 RepID=UPI00037D1A1F|nr:amidase [Sciscionella marina]